MAKSFFGLGDYKIKDNVFLSGRLPQMMNIPGGGGTIIRFQEYLGDVITSGSANTFDLRSYDINAALFDTFPWLSQIAQNYEQYSFEGLVFEFRSTSADALNSTNTALGSVMMATNYDASDPEFASKSEMLNYEFSSSCKPAENVMHMVECAPKQTVLTELYTRSGAVPANDDQRFYDLGKFQIATTGFQGTDVNVGELHCTYQVRLLKPKLHEALGEATGFARFSNDTGVNATNPFGTVDNIQTHTGNLDAEVTTGAFLNFPRTNVVQSYMIVYRVVGTVAGAIVYPTLGMTNGSLPISPAATNTPVAATSTTTAEMVIFVQTSANGEVPILALGTAGTFPTGTTSMSCIVTQIPNSVCNAP